MRPALLVAFALVLAAGCAVPRRGGFDDVQKLLRERGVQTVHWRLGGPEDEAVDAHVRKLLSGPLTVSDAMQIALLQSPRLQRLYERLGVAQADLVQAGLLHNPSFGVHVGLPFGTPPWSGTAWEFSLVQEFLDLFMMPLRKKLARAELERTKLEVADAVLEQLAEVRAAYFTAMAARQVAALRRVVAEAADAAAELAERQRQAGTLSDLDTASEQGALAQARLDLLRADQQAVADRERLVRLLGLWGRRTAFQLPERLPEVPSRELSVEDAEAFAIAHRLDLKAAKQELAVVKAALRATQATRFLGALELGGDAHREPEGFKVMGPSLSLQLPIFDQGQARIARLYAIGRAAQARIDELAIDVRSQVREIANRMQTARSAAAYYRGTVLPLRERIVALAQQQYNAMLLGVYQLLQAKQNEVNAYREYIETVRDYWIARSDLERAAGGQLPVRDVEDVNQGEAR